MRELDLERVEIDSVSIVSAQHVAAAVHGLRRVTHEVPIEHNLWPPPTTDTPRPALECSMDQIPYVSGAGCTMPRAELNVIVIRVGHSVNREVENPPLELAVRKERCIAE